MPLAEPPRDAAAGDGSAPVPLHVVAWDDPPDVRTGFDPRSLYVELFWLPILGPSAVLLLRRLADGLDATPQGFTLDPETTARSLGLGGSEGRHSAFRRTVGRCIRFGLVRQAAPGLLAVRRTVRPLPPRHVSRLPPPLREAHERWATPIDVPRTLHRRARLLALELTAAGAGPEAVERKLAGWGVDPTVAGDTARWLTAVVRDIRGAGEDRPDQSPATGASTAGSDDGG